MIGSIAYRLFGTVALILMSGCLAGFPHHAGTAEQPAFRPEVFFAGRTVGVGTLVTRGGSRRSLRVEGNGHTEADGTFRLDQTVTFGDGTVETRTWRMHRVDAHNYTATLSDATGEVSAQATGNLFHLHYLLRRPAVYMDQRLYLQPDGRKVLNLATITIVGIPWARLSEEITHTDDSSSQP